MTSENDDLTCNLSHVEKMKPWVEGEKEGDDCRVCCLQPAASWYLSELEENGQTVHAEALKTVFEQGDPLTIAKTLDTIKSDVGTALREKLERFDCLCQSLSQEQSV